MNTTQQQLQTSIEPPTPRPILKIPSPKLSNRFTREDIAAYLKKSRDATKCVREYMVKKRQKQTPLKSCKQRGIVTPCSGISPDAPDRKLKFANEVGKELEQIREISPIIMETDVITTPVLRQGEALSLHGAVPFNGTVRKFAPHIWPVYSPKAIHTSPMTPHTTPPAHIQKMLRVVSPMARPIIVSSASTLNEKVN